MMNYLEREKEREKLAEQNLNNHMADFTHINIQSIEEP